MLSVKLFSKLFRQGRNNLEQITNNAIIGNIENRRVRILVYGNNDLGCFHAGQMLYLSGNSAGDIEVGAHRAAGLSYLMGIRYP